MKILPRIIGIPLAIIVIILMIPIGLLLVAYEVVEDYLINQTHD